jgi:hypothetical protein
MTGSECKNMRRMLKFGAASLKNNLPGFRRATYGPVNDITTAPVPSVDLLASPPR